MMTDDTSILTTWYTFVACSPGFLGSALHIYRQRTGLSSTQQRTLLGLQAMPPPRSDHVGADLQRILAHRLTLFPDRTIHTAQLAPFLRTPVEP